MNYCKYHPIAPATHYCPNCDSYTCDKCVNDEKGLGIHAKCFLCSQNVESLGASQTATPFWRRLKESFSYPVNIDTLVFIFAAAFLSSLAEYMPLGIILILILTGAIFKYGFTCLQNSAEGDFKAPHVYTAYQGGLVLIIQLFLLCLVVVGIITLSYYQLGTAITMLVGTILIGALPAMIITFSLTDNIFAAFNPITSYQLIRAVGLPYGLLLAFMMIMSASLGVIGEILSYFPSIISGTLGTAAFNFYLIVIFHIMGYMIFQYQGDIGFIAREEEDSSKRRDDKQRKRALIDIHLKEGNYERVLTLFIEQIRTHTKDRPLHADFFNYLCAIKDKDNLEKIANNYFPLLSEQGLLEQLYIEFRRCINILPTFIPASAEIRHQLAERAMASDDAKTCIHLVDGLNEQAKNYIKLPEVYDLLAKAFLLLPNMETQAEAAKQVAESYRVKKLPPKRKAPIGKKRPLPPSGSLTNNSGVLNTDFQARNPIDIDPLDIKDSDSAENNSQDKELPSIDFKF